MPRYNPNDENSLARLRDAVDFSRQRLRPFRENRADMIDMYVGSSYGDGGTSGEVIINLVELAVNIYQRQLASHAPQVMVDTPIRALNPVAVELTMAVNYLIEHQIDLGETLNDAVYDAMFNMAIVKVGITPPEHHELQGFTHDSGRIFSDVVDFADWVHDMNAARWDQIEYCGNRYRVPLENVLESPLFDKKAKQFLAPMLRNEDESFERGDDEHPAALSQGKSPMPLEVNNHVTLWDIWLPHEGLVVTYPAGGLGTALRVVEWDGPEHGPYHRLGFAKVPSNIIPLAPAMLWEDINDLINRLALKAGQQADRQKTVLAGQNRASAAMEAILDTPDGMSLVTDIDPNLIKEFSFGGVDGNLMGALGNFKDLFSYVAGNLDSLGGLSPQAETLGQDRLITASASQRINDMQDRVVKFTTGIVRDIAWYLWNDPLANIALKRKVTDSIEIDVSWNTDSRAGDFFDYQFSVVPHSLQSKTPAERLQFLMQIVNTVIIPLRPLLQQQGITFDIEEFLKQVARLSNSPDIEKIVRREVGLPLQPHGTPESEQSPNTTRTYVRMDRGGNARQQQQQFQLPPNQQQRPETAVA